MRDARTTCALASIRRKNDHTPHPATRRVGPKLPTAHTQVDQALQPTVVVCPRADIYSLVPINNMAQIST